MIAAMVLALSIYAMVRGCLIIFATTLSGRDAAQAPFPTILLLVGGAIGAAVSAVWLLGDWAQWVMAS